MHSGSFFRDFFFGYFWILTILCFMKVNSLKIFGFEFRNLLAWEWIQAVYIFFWPNVLWPFCMIRHSYLLTKHQKNRWLVVCLKRGPRISSLTLNLCAVFFPFWFEAPSLRNISSSVDKKEDEIGPERYGQKFENQKNHSSCQRSWCDRSRLELELDLKH